MKRCLLATLAMVGLSSLAWAQPEVHQLVDQPPYATAKKHAPQMKDHDNVDRPGFRKRPGNKERRILRQLHQKYEVKNQDVIMRLSQRRLELAQLLRNDGSDKPTVKAKVQEIMVLERQRQDLMVDEYFEAKSEMSPEDFVNYRGRVLHGLLRQPPRERGDQ